ncbi:hypothetical protein L1987_50326 [Smallanthus sonchifolius]|uniref:Uncharacterized protein n=1 Tax=Smallanthus sonchifolius TaxID=185202 RepID=A0ACB9ELP8_9ASTR|nr:hypothetical protein L1987_50326 [Smallanthus sonchifolius]
MDKNGSVIVIFLVFIFFFGQSDAFDLRKLVATPDLNGSFTANQDSASSSPPPPDKAPNLSPVEAPKPKDTPITNLSELESKGLNDSYTKKGSESSSEKKLDTGKNQDGKGSETFASKYCKRNPICNDQGKTIMACAQDFENGSNILTLNVQNEQDVDLKVNITFGTSMTNYLPTFVIPAHGTEEVNITISGDKSNKVILNAGNGDCELQINQPSPVNSTSKSKVPVNNSNNKDVGNPADSPIKPKDVNNPADSPKKPKDVDDPAKSKDKNTPPKAKDVNLPPKSKDVDELSKSKDADDLSKSKDTKDLPKSKEADDTTKSKSKDVDDPSKSTTISVDTPVSKNNFVDQMTFYSKQVTPMHGAYLAFLVALVVGGSWALCSFRKRRTDGGVPYQELEMGPSESSNAVDVEAAEGWDQDWDDDDWDEDKAIRSPGGSINAKTISSNGLTSRATKKDGWDADWDD